MPVERSKALHFDSWKELLRWLPQASEGQLMTVFVWAGEQDKLPADDPTQRRPVIELARQELGWQPGVPLDQGLPPTIAYFRELLGAA